MAIRDLMELLALREAQQAQFSGPGAPQAPQAPAPPQGLGAVDRLFGAPSSPKQARSLAMLNAGLTIAASRGSTPEGLLAGLRAGTETYAAAEEAGRASRAQQMREQIMQGLASGEVGPEQILQVAQQLIAAGDVEGGKALIDVAEAQRGPEAEPFTLSPGQTRFSPTGEPIASAEPEEEDLMPRDISETATGWFDGQGNLVRTTARVLDPGKLFTEMTQLASGYRADTGRQAIAASSYGQILAAAEDPSAAGDLAMIFGFMRMVDPGSSVKEGEFANAQNAANVPERIRGLYNRLLTGERLTTAQKQDFLRTAGRMAGAYRKELQNIGASYRKRVGGRLDADDIIIDYFEPFLGPALRNPSGRPTADDFMGPRRP